VELAVRLSHYDIAIDFPSTDSLFAIDLLSYVLLNFGNTDNRPFAVVMAKPNASTMLDRSRETMAATSY